MGKGTLFMVIRSPSNRGRRHVTWCHAFARYEGNPLKGEISSSELSSKPIALENSCLARIDPAPASLLLSLTVTSSTCIFLPSLFPSLLYLYPGGDSVNKSLGSTKLCACKNMFLDSLIKQDQTPSNSTNYSARVSTRKLPRQKYLNNFITDIYVASSKLIN